LVGALDPKGPYVVLALAGEHGSAKSTTSRVFKALIDPNSDPIRKEPREVRDLRAAAGGNWVIGFDNLSYLRAWLSDTMCRLSTGCGFSERQLFTNEEENVFCATRPMVFNAIEEVAERPDLLDRCMLIECPKLVGKTRLRESKFWPGFQEAQPRILGALLNAASIGLRNLPTLEVDDLPRMADFAFWAACCAEGLGTTPQKLLNAYTRNINRANSTALSVSVLTEPVKAVLKKHKGYWRGTPTRLLTLLSSNAHERVVSSKEWPELPQVLTGRLKRLAPNLRRIGIYYKNKQEREGNNVVRMITLKYKPMKKSDNSDNTEATSMSPEC